MASCLSGKRSFGTPEYAEEFSKMLLRRFPEQARQRVYPCDMCAAWHLTKLAGPRNLHRTGAPSHRPI